MAVDSRQLAIESSPHTFDYIEVIKLGFIRYEESDQVFYDKYGYRWFRVEKRLMHNIIACWDSVTRTIELIRTDGDSNIIARLQVMTRIELKMYLDFFQVSETSNTEPES